MTVFQQLQRAQHTSICFTAIVIVIATAMFFTLHYFSFLTSIVFFTLWYFFPNCIFIFNVDHVLAVKLSSAFSARGDGRYVVVVVGRIL